MPTLSWIGKDAVIKHHREVPYRILRDVPDGKDFAAIQTAITTSG